MVFEERTYSVLVVTAGQKFRDAMAAMLPYSAYYPVCYSESVAAARRELLARSYDFVIISTPLPDDFGTQLAIDVCSRSDSVALLLLRADAYGEINAKVCPYGVFTLQLPVSTQSIKQCLGWMAAARERLRSLVKKTISIEDKMEEIRLVTRATWILIEQLKMTESEAHRHIEKQAMDRCVSKKEIAFGIINTYT